jgi:excisionase family DNA binding protein
MEGSKLLSVEEAATKLGISPLTMRAWLRQRRLPFVRLGRRVLLHPEDIENFVDTNRVKPIALREGIH